MGPYDAGPAEERLAYFLSKAKEADERAAKCAQIETQKTWTELAASWRFMAAQVNKDLKP